MTEYNGYSQLSDRFGFRALGTFRCVRQRESFLFVIVAVIYILCLCIVVWNAVIVLSSDLSVPIFDYDKKMSDYAPTLNLLCVILSVIIMMLLTVAAWIAVKIITNGSVYSYTANEEVFIITDPKGEKTRFYYSDIESVTYSELTTLFARQRGFDVTVHTKYRSYYYQYIYSKNKLLKEEKDTPFFILEERAGLKTRRYTDEMGV